MKEYKSFKIIEKLDDKNMQKILNYIGDSTTNFFTFDESIYECKIVLRAVIDTVVIETLIKQGKEDLLKKYNLLKNSVLSEDFYTRLEETIIDEYYEEREGEEGYEWLYFSISSCSHREILEILEKYLSNTSSNEFVTTYKFDEIQKMTSYEDIVSSNIDSFYSYSEMEIKEWDDTFNEQGDITFVKIQGFSNLLANELEGDYRYEEIENSTVLMFDELTISNKDLFIEKIYKDMQTYDLYLSADYINELYKEIK